MVRDVEKRVILGMQPPTCDNMEIDVGKYDVKSNVDDEMDCVVYWTKLLTLWRNLIDETKSFWQERANTLNAWTVVGLILRIFQYLQETVFFHNAIFNDWIAMWNIFETQWNILVKVMMVTRIIVFVLVAMCLFYNGKYEMHIILCSLLMEMFIGRN